MSFEIRPRSPNAPRFPPARRLRRRAGGNLGRAWYLRRVLTHKTWLPPDKLAGDLGSEKMWGTASPLVEYGARGAKMVYSISALEVTLRIPNYLLNLPKSPPFRQARVRVCVMPISSDELKVLGKGSDQRLRRYYERSRFHSREEPQCHVGDR